MISFFAHAGEAHASSTESAVHWLSTWYIALPLFLLGTALVAALVYFASKRSMAATYLSVVGIFLVSGIFLYDKSPVVSTVALASGLFGSVLVVLTSLSKKDKK